MKSFIKLLNLEASNILGLLYQQIKEMKTSSNPEKYLIIGSMSLIFKLVLSNVLFEVASPDKVSMSNQSWR